jgi:hypothetical protein
MPPCSRSDEGKQLNCQCNCCVNVVYHNIRLWHLLPHKLGAAVS